LPVTAALLGLLIVGSSGMGCDRASSTSASARADAEHREQRERLLRDRASTIAVIHARRVRLIAEDMAKLHPRSTRSEASREAKKLLEEIVPNESENRGLR
jgi:hypothetical protein